MIFVRSLSIQCRAGTERSFGFATRSSLPVHDLVEVSMEQQRRSRLTFLLLIIAWAAGSSVAASRPMEAGLVEGDNSRSDCQPQQVALLP